MSVNTCRLILFSNVRPLFLGNRTSVSGIRTLYSLNAIGVDNYITAREKVALQFKEITDKFKSKMLDYSNPETANMIFTEDLKHMVHLVEPNKEDLDLVEQMMLKFCRQNVELRFGSFIFGPVVMRMYHHLNKPEEALKVFKNPEMGGFFDQLISFQILMDLLYRNEMYSEMLEVFNIISDKQIQRSKYPKNSVVLVLAACYKLNTEASYNFAKQLWANLIEIGHYPTRRSGTFAAALALKQNAPGVALEILSSMKQQSYVTIRNLKVAALSDLGRPDDVFPILWSVLEYDRPDSDVKQTFLEEILEKVSAAVDKTNKPPLKKEFERINDKLHSSGCIGKEHIDDLLCKEISLPPNTSSRPDHSYTQRTTYNRRRQFNDRPNIRQML